MKKNSSYQVTNIYKENGWYIVSLYNTLGMYYKDLRFLYYNKKEVIYLLRNKYNISVPHKFY